MSRLHRGALLAAGLACAVQVLPAIAQPETRGAARFVEWSYGDAAAWLTSWDAGRLVTVAGVTAALVPLSYSDPDLSLAVGQRGSGPVRGMLDRVNYLGGAGSVAIPAGVFGLSLLGDDRRFQDAAFTSLQSYLYTNGIVFLIKSATGRSRPEVFEGAHEFRPFSGATSFPSGHTANAFSIVMPWVFYYPGPVTYAMVAVAAGTAAARVEREKHWATDVVAGMLISTTMAYYLTKRHRGHAGGGIRIMPSFGPGSLSMSVSVGL